MTGNRSLDEFVGRAASESADVEDPDPEPETSSDAAASTPESTDADGPIEAEESAAADESTEADGLDGADGPEDVDGPDRADDAGASDAVEAMAETVAWSPDGGECTACGGSVEERWRDGDEMVCGDCKAW